MGRVTLLGPDGDHRSSGYYGADSGESSEDGAISNDGFITDIEISRARETLEARLNENICGYGGPLGYGGLGGINEVCVQPWNMGGPAREETPDGYSMPVTVHLWEEYSVPTAVPIFRTYRSVEREVAMTARWESGRIRLYQCTPPLYTPPPPPAPMPDPIAALGETVESIGQGLRGFIGGTERLAGTALNSLRRFFA